MVILKKKKLFEVRIQELNINHKSISKLERYHYAYTYNTVLVLLSYKMNGPSNWLSTTVILPFWFNVDNLTIIFNFKFSSDHLNSVSLIPAVYIFASKNRGILFPDYFKFGTFICPVVFLTREIDVSFFHGLN